MSYAIYGDIILTKHFDQGWVVGARELPEIEYVLQSSHDGCVDLIFVQGC
jgi:hypothetical protein